MSNIAVSYHTTPVGELIIGSYEHHICLCDWRYRNQRERVDLRIQNGLKANFKASVEAVHHQLIEELTAYFNGTLQSFKTPYLTVGTAFQKQVWLELTQIAYGSTVSYSTLSRKLNHPEAIRAVATANGANALSILIPCHRVIGKDGALTGYAGGLPAKKKLLQLEGALHNDQLKLFK